MFTKASWSPSLGLELPAAARDGEWNLFSYADRNIAGLIAPLTASHLPHSWLVHSIYTQRIGSVHVPFWKSGVPAIKQKIRNQIGSLKRWLCRLEYLLLLQRIDLVSCILTEYTRFWLQRTKMDFSFSFTFKIIER